MRLPGPSRCRSARVNVPSPAPTSAQTPAVLGIASAMSNSASRSFIASYSIHYAPRRAVQGPVSSPHPMKELLERLRTAVADRYQVDREVGRGAMAPASLAHVLRHHRPVPLHGLPPPLALSFGPAPVTPAVP